MRLAQKIAEIAELKAREEPLLPELRLFMTHNPRDGYVLYHELFTGFGFDPDHAAHINARYREVSKKAEEAIGKRDWQGYTFLHERPHRLDALLRCTNAVCLVRTIGILLGKSG